MKILALYDGTIHSKNALSYGMRKAKESNGELVVLHIFQSALFVDYDAGPQAEEFARREAAGYIAEAKDIINKSGNGMAVRLVSEEGDPERELLRYAASERPGLILVPPRYKEIAKTAPCPVYIIPGTILVPVDDSEGLLASVDRIRDEALATGSRVLLLGVVPVHLYSTSEEKELGLVEKKTAATVKKLKTTLKELGMDVSEIIRPGYPDEEILKAADEYAVSLILLPSGGRTPSQLSKAAAVILDEPDKLKRPVFIVPVPGAA